MTATPVPVGPPGPAPTKPVTAAALLAAEQSGVAVEGEELLYAPDLPADLAAAVRVLATGVRALLNRVREQSRGRGGG